MRNLIYAINLTLDGCCDHTTFNPDEGMLEHYTRLLQDVDLLVYGRKTYQLMVPYWPDIAKNETETKADLEFARAFVSLKKVVFHDHWPARKMEIRELLVRTFAMKYLS